MEDRTLLLHNMRHTPRPSTPVLVMSKLITTVLPIAQIVVGGLFLNKCPQQHFIPIYLVVAGAFELALAVLSCLPCTKETEEGGQSQFSSLCTLWNSLVCLFLFCWFITGNVWIYSIYPPIYDEAMPLYCNKTLYLFAFWSTTLVYILVGMLLVGGCCGIICMCLCGSSRTSSDDV